jgi:hypothetical protein
LATSGIASILGAVNPKRDAASRTPPKQPWHAVSVVAGVHACSSALQCKGKRFLAAEAPRLPLPDCGSPWRCKCTYRHHGDRRAGSRRAADLGMSRRFDESEKRRSPGRRTADRSEMRR